MQVVQELAGFTLGGADILRRAIGKKKIDVLREQKAKFVEGCWKTNQIDEKLADQIWDKIAMFAGYGFNKSHSAAYAFLAYRTAYLKANYPAEFMAAVLTSELSNADKIAFFIAECREMGIKILPPDIDTSERMFTVDKGAIRFGLAAIKGVGDNVANAIIDTRKKEGKFKSFLDFCERCGSQLNSRVVDHLTKAGAFDTLGLRRSQILAIAEPTMQMASSRVKDRAVGNVDMFFDMMAEDDAGDAMSVPIPDIPEFEEAEILALEKELLGFYVTGHPLGKYADIISTYSSASVRKILEMDDNLGVQVGCMIKTVQKKVSQKSGKPFAIMTIEDLDGSIECMVYERALSKLQDQGIDLVEEMPIMLRALTSKREEAERVKLVAEEIFPLDSVMQEQTKEIHMHVYEASTPNDTLKSLKKLCNDSPGDARVIICVTCNTGEIAFIETSRMMSVKVEPGFLDQVQQLLGEKRYKLKADIRVPEGRKRYTPQFSNANSNGNGGENSNG